ncbi:MAG: TolC family protein [gamma proteobacterium symbiont of Bathyaustriella thionipta]|nr:TolC family protein [gamma proteobacterium symbiont of Bathyaustriella thionipta]
MLCSAVSAQPLPLPEPLSLQAALQIAEESDPTLDVSRAEIEAARAQKLATDARMGFYLGLEAQARWVDPSELGERFDSTRNDSFATLKLSKRLYDFGASDHLMEAASRDVSQQELLYFDARQQRYLRIMKNFFEVLLADQEYARDNELMAVAYVRFDHATDEHELGDLSDVELLRLQTEYQRLRYQRQLTESRQRSSRLQLAIVLNRAGQLPSDLLMPDLPQLERKLPGLELLTAQTLQSNATLQALQLQVDANKKRIKAAQSLDNPIISGEIEAGAYHRQFGGDDNAAAALVLEIPILNGGATQAEVAKARADLWKAQARLTSLQASLRQQVLDQWLAIRNLHIQAEQLAVQSDYRDLHLDHSRALYELEVATDLGDAMGQQSDVVLQQMKNRFQLALAWGQMDALTGQLLRNENKPDREQEPE